jgi:putative addiction module CopG family antidote
MTLSLTPELKKLIAENVASGAYASADELVREALRLLAAQDAALRQRIATGAAQPDRGECGPFDAAAVERIRASGQSDPSGRSNARNRRRQRAQCSTRYTSASSVNPLVTFSIASSRIVRNPASRAAAWSVIASTFCCVSARSFSFICMISYTARRPL